MSEQPVTKSKAQLVGEFVKTHPKKVAAIAIALLSMLSQENREIAMAILAAITSP